MKTLSVLIILLAAKVGQASCLPDGGDAAAPPAPAANAAAFYGVRRPVAAFDGAIYCPAPSAGTAANPKTLSGGQINLPVKSGDKSPHSIKNPTAYYETPTAYYGVRRPVAAFDGAIYCPAPSAGTVANPKTPSCGQINLPVESGDKSPHSIKNPAAATPTAAASAAPAAVNYSYAWALLTKQLDGGHLTGEEQAYVDLARKPPAPVAALSSSAAAPLASTAAPAAASSSPAPAASASAPAARHFYADPALGDDRAAGTAAAPVRTLARAVSLLRPGDTLHLAGAGAASTYRETLEILDLAGTPGAPVTIDGHGATLDGCDPVPRKDWREVSPGLYSNVRLIDQLSETNDATKLQRMFFVIDGVHQRMGRTSKGRDPGLKKPADLAPGEWTFAARGRAFYVRLDGTFADDRARILAPVRRNGVSLMGLRGIHDLVIKNITVTRVLNDGFNLHGHGIARVRFENIAAAGCGDDGFSAHEDADHEIDGLAATGNSTGLANAYATALRARGLRLEGNHAVDLYLGHSARAEIADSIINTLRLTRPAGLRLCMQNVRTAVGAPLALKTIPAGAEVEIK
jgi:hypothetical protein